MASMPQQGLADAGADQDVLVPFREMYEALEISDASLQPERLFRLLTARVESLRQFNPAYVSAKGKVAGVTVQNHTLQISYDGSQISIPVDSKQKQIGQELRKRFGLEEDEAQTLLLLRQFLRSESEERLQAIKDAEEMERKHKEALGSSLLPKQASFGISSKDQSAVTDLHEEFYDAFTVFYFGERISLLQCISALLRIADDVEHENQESARSIVQMLAPATLSSPDKSFGLNCLQHLQHNLIDAEMPASVRENVRYATFWAVQGLRQQTELLDTIFLLCHTHTSPTAEFALGVLHIIHGTNFGKRQGNSGFYAGKEAQGLLKAVSSLLCLISVESIGVERLLDGETCLRKLLPSNAGPSTMATGKSQPGSGAAHLAASPELLNEALNIIEALRFDVLWGPVLVAWALLLNRIDAAFENLQASDVPHTPGTAGIPAHLHALHAIVDIGAQGPAIWTKLANLAFSPPMQLNKTMADVLACLSDASIKSFVASPSHLAYRTAFKSILLSETELVKPEFIQDHEALLRVWELVFGNVDPADEFLRQGTAALCEQFWGIDARHDMRSAMLRMSTGRWPILFRPLLRLLRVLSGRHTASNQGSASSFASEQATASATSVFEYFSSLPSIAHILPPPKALGNPYEAVESSDHDAIVYRLVQPLQIFGKQNVLPVGTVGRVVSDRNTRPVTVIWELDSGGFSGWRLLRDVLASFVSLLVEENEGQDPDRSNIFADGNDTGPTDFSALTPEASDQDRMDAAGDALELFASVLSAGHVLSLRLFAHLDNADAQVMELEGAQAKRAGSQHASLTRIVVRMLDLCLAQPRLDTRLVSAAYTVLTHLLEVRPASVWTALRPSNVLVGSAGLLSLKRSDSDPNMLQSALLEAEMHSGEYEGLLAVLDLHTALVLELQQSQFSAPTYLLELKAWVAARGLTWITECVWSDCLNWRYATMNSKLMILRKCIRIFNAVFSDRMLRGAAVGPLASVYGVLERAFLSGPSALTMSSLLSILACSNSLVQECGRSGSALLSDSAARLVRSTLLLSFRIVQRRRDMNSTATKDQVRLGAIEAIIFDPALVGQQLSKTGGKIKSRVQIAATLIDVINTLYFPEAAMLLAEAVLSVAETTRRLDRASMALIGSLGSLSEMQKRFEGLVRLAGPERDNLSPLASTLWGLFSALTELQPALAAVFVTGEHLDYARKANEDKEKGKKNGAKAASDASALLFAVHLIEDWELLWRQDASLLENALKFVNTAWLRRAEHPHAFQSLLERKPLWEKLVDLLKRDESEDVEADEVQIIAVRLACKSRALRLISTSIASQEQSKDTGRNNVQALVDFISATDTFKMVLANAAQVTFNAGMIGLSEDDMKTLAPSFPFGLLRNPPVRDDFDMSRPFGDSYVFDFGLLATKLVGYQSPDANNVKEGENMTPEASAQAGGIVVAVNREWSVVDSQIFYLRAWHELLAGCTGSLLAHAQSDKEKIAKLRASAFQTWLAVAATATEFTGAGLVHEGIHRARLSLLATLLELAWVETSNVEKAAIPELLGVIANVQSLLEKSEPALEASLRGLTPEPLHRDLFRLIFLASLKYRDFTVANKKKGLLDSKQHREAHKTIDIFALHVISSLRVVSDSARPIFSNKGDVTHVFQLEEDISILTSILNLLIRPEADLAPHFLSATMQATSLLPACIELFIAAPHGQTASKTAESSGAIATSLLSLFLTLSAHPTLSETVVLSGLMTALSNNASSSALESGSVRAVTLTGEHTPQHQCWLLMLRIVTSLAISFAERLDTATSQGFVTTEVISFVQLYQAQFDRIIDFSPVTDAGPKFFTINGEESRSFTEADLEEVETGVQLLVVVTEHIAAAREMNHHAKLISNIARGCAKLLQQTSYLLLRPRLLSSTFGDEASEGASEQEKGAVARAEASISKRTENIVMGMVALISNYTRAADILCTDTADLLTDAPVITPRLRVSPSESATIGTLIDVAQHFADQLKSTAGKSKAHLAQLTLSLEQTLTLAVTQLSVALYNRNDGPHLSPAQANAQTQAASLAQKEVDAGLGRDVGSAIAGAQSVLANGAGDEAPLLVILQGYVDRHLLSRSRAVSVGAS
ncbi:hypothetical protein K437DRAFT_255640 [Tilletiaria anomala UBC 951]|uniref:Nucleoporin Nup188 N-terminal subdomain III domain-containing protein n=1 Tax=Tilletiaria anomala (strain ATCC 24038 / CBS 436.72 / UBC 951) TaxID=1037660 RepID=A0A066WBQ2_TILAU|nr:uncharacterized protein K437DRAFT_255640 [Tilletiaria anomala UBC 951]KDN48210.1 hypothetical protein K437DRAFT_255640 [Tilletiaria anomala UBC 951]